jgi:hypothetical protein
VAGVPCNAVLYLKVEPAGGKTSMALAGCDLPRNVRLEVAQLSDLCRGTGLSNDEIQHRLERLRELRVLLVDQDLD